MEKIMYELEQLLLALSHIKVVVVAVAMEAWAQVPDILAELI
jgi:hypothetical protein